MQGMRFPACFFSLQAGQKLNRTNKFGVTRAVITVDDEVELEYVLNTFYIQACSNSMLEFYIQAC
jgi:hypothetical protein